MKKPTGRRNAAEGGAVPLLKAGGTGFLLGIVLLLIIASLGAYLGIKSPAPGGTALPAAMAALFGGGYPGALLAGNKSKGIGRNPYLGGFLCGGMLLLTMTVMSFFFPAAEGRSAMDRLLPLGVLLLATLLGSLTAAVHRPGNKKKLKKLKAGRR